MYTYLAAEHPESKFASQVVGFLYTQLYSVSKQSVAAELAEAEAKLFENKEESKDDDEDEPTAFTCYTCSYVNELDQKVCALCQAEKRASKSSWNALEAAQGGSDKKKKKKSGGGAKASGEEIILQSPTPASNSGSSYYGLYFDLKAQDSDVLVTSLVFPSLSTPSQHTFWTTNEYKSCNSIHGVQSHTYIRSYFCSYFIFKETQAFLNLTSPRVQPLLTHPSQHIRYIHEILSIHSLLRIPNL